WEDKLIFLLIPLLLLFLIKTKKYKTTSFLIGFTIAYNGLTIFFLPIYLIFLFTEIKTNFLPNIGLIFLGITVGLIPFFPESLSAWGNRLIRVDSSKPFWYSFYYFLPKGLYSPSLNKILILTISLITIFLFWLKKINLIDSLILSISTVIIFSPYNVISRVIPLILLITILSPNMNRLNWISLSLILFVFPLINNGYSTPVINAGSIILFYIPLLYSIFTYLYKRISTDIPNKSLFI
ncbi:MAG: hypothetical protein ACFFD1_14290, partial [Candidatus Thorarchaeota archaeon]